MIIQGSNTPIIFTFPENMTEIKDIEISLYTNSDKTELKHWSIEDVSINERDIDCPLTQTETLAFPAETCTIEIKWTDENGDTNFARKMSVSIQERKDKTILDE